jgi:radical SAM-linked protein
VTEIEAASTTLHRIRLTFARQEALRYVSHLDMLMVWERTLRRAGMPLAYSKGFNPKPRLHQAAALPLGFLSQCEITDIWLETPADAPAPNLTEIAARIQAAAPPGLLIVQSEFVPLSLPPLQTQVQSAEYVAKPLDEMDRNLFAEAVKQLLNTDTLPRERRGKAYDLRPLIEDLQVRQGENNRPGLYMRLAAREGATGRPEEVLSALDLDPSAFRVVRTALILQQL